MVKLPGLAIVLCLANNNYHFYLTSPIAWSRGSYWKGSHLQVNLRDVIDIFECVIHVRVTWQMHDKRCWKLAPLLPILTESWDHHKHTSYKKMRCYSVGKTCQLRSIDQKLTTSSRNVWIRGRYMSVILYSSFSEGMTCRPKGHSFAVVFLRPLWS